MFEYLASRDVTRLFSEYYYIQRITGVTVC